MGLAQSFNNAVHQQLASYAAWMPIVNTFKIGEYGVFKDGIFNSQGNLKDKYPDINLVVEKGPPADIDFLSSGTKKFKFDVNGNSIPTFAGLGGANASLKIVFENADSSMIKAKLSVEVLKNIDEVGTALANKDNWQNKFSVVSKVYTGENCVVICSKEAGTEIEIKADANLLQQIEAGKVTGEVDFTSNRDSTFKAIGETGVLALGLFKLNIFNNVKVLSLNKGEHFDIVDIKGDEIEDDY